MDVSGDYIVIDIPEEDSSEESYITIPFYDEDISDNTVPEDLIFYDVSEDNIYDSSAESPAEYSIDYNDYSETAEADEEESISYLLNSPESTDSVIEVKSSESVSENFVNSPDIEFSIVLLFEIGAVAGIILGSLLWWRLKT